MKFFDKLSAWWIVAIYFILLLAMGCVYYCLTPSEHGLYLNGESVNDLTFCQALYFSAVTISSLGYGDYQPMGYSRAIASAEVIIGLALMGMLIYKLTSLRTSHHLNRLYNSDITGNLHRYAKDFTTVHESMGNSLPTLASHARSTPTMSGSTNALSMRQIEEAQEKASQSLSGLHKQIAFFKSFIRDEDIQKDFFNIASLPPMGDAIDSLTDCIKFLEQSLIAIAARSTTAIVGSTGARYIGSILKTTREILDYVELRTMKQDTRDKFDNLVSAYENLDMVFRIAPPDTDNIQPDQELEEPDDPT